MTNLDRLSLLPAVSLAVAYEGPVHPQLFQMNGGRATAIRVRRPCDLDHQARLARALFDLAPVMEKRDAWEPPLRFAEEIAARLGAPLRVASFGPSAEDKRPGLTPGRPSRARRRSARTAPGTPPATPPR